MKRLRDLITGAVIGALLVTGATAGYAAVKQYVLTDAPYPIIVNGVEYKDAERPILNLEGSTYVPLAKLGDLTGVDYTWNAELHRVEINTGSGSQPNQTSPSPPVSGTPGAKFEPADQPTGGTYFGYRDEDDPAYERALIMGYEIPPLLSEGWISSTMLSRIHGIFYPSDFDAPRGTLILATDSILDPYELIRLQLPESYSDETNFDHEDKGIRMKRFNGTWFFQIKDLEHADVIPEDIK
ncbi:hypothetical protein DUZ99_01980 [Xylanibacillus composti]|uniref:Copper amine oxidase-like N-terminal domain-containing protein n=1 Tax=Xylanibacillus composti TaxID=1572762 RepID=A0A8J4H6S5_9BACL|nr:hypothetical protein [Xylanibacillus composti]MDT9723763.1 hypothetical protein [Xylanibacillus composti]GIQ70767.1 hypothetical protein XYCOK13_35910 [Xylanibacillus composti]